MASVRGQTRRDWELVIVDDASDDSTPERAEELAAEDHRVRVVRHGSPRGGSAARNSGIHAASASWVAFIDDDAEWRPEKLERQLELAGPEAGPSLVYARVLAVGEDGATFVLGAPVDAVRPFESLARGNRIDTSGALVDRQTLLEVGGFDPALPRLQDWDVWLRVAPRVRLVYDDAVLASTFQVGPRISTDRAALRTAAARLAEKHPSSATLLATLGHMLLAQGEPALGRELLARASAIERRPGIRLRQALAAVSPGAYRVLARASERLNRSLTRGRSDPGGHG